MSYSEFTIDQIKKVFGIRISEKFGIFSEIAEEPPSEFLSQILEKYVPLALAIDTEKARSEFIIAPILFEVKSNFLDKVSLFSGKEFNVNSEMGLNGRCDFLISRSPEQLIIEAPIFALVEAKNDNIQSGLGQCMAEMIAAQIFNQRQENEIEIIYGAVTTGTNWKFMRLQGQEIEIDLNEYFLNQVGKIMGILKSGIELN